MGRKGLVVASVVVALGLAELVLRLAAPVADPYWRERTIETGSYVPMRHAPNHVVRVRPEPGLPGVSQDRRFETNDRGWVGPALAADKPASERRVFLVGGSTMECVVLGTEKNPATTIAKRLAARSSTVTWNVQNTAHSGDASFDHVAVVTHRVLHHEPDVIVVMAGVNDLLASLRGEDYAHDKPDHAVTLDTVALARLALTRSHLARLVLGVVGSASLRFASGEGEPSPTRYRATAARCRDLPAATLPPLDLDGYRRNLTTLVAAAKANGVRVVLTTQPHSWRAPEREQWWWLGCLDGRRYPPAELAAALGRYDDVTREVARIHGVVVVDLARTITSADAFYDDVHFSDAGADQVAAAIADAI